MAPVIRRSVGGIDAEGLDGVDRVEDFFDLRPAGQPEQAFSAWPNVRHGRVTLPGPCRAQDVDARDDGAVVVGGPTDERKDAVRRKRDEAPLTVEDVLLCGAAEADPVLDTLLDPHK